MTGYSDDKERAAMSNLLLIAALLAVKYRI